MNDTPTPEPPVHTRASLPAKAKLVIQRLVGGAEPYHIGQTKLLVLISLFMALAYNGVFFGKVFAIYPPGFKYLLFHIAIFSIVVH